MECARLRCLSRKCELRTADEVLKLQTEADPMEDISLEDRDPGDSGSLETAAGFFDEHDSEDDVLVPKGERDYLMLACFQNL